ncbi:Gfo/Idh/MocA family oxidoreductase [Ignisphaera sp. 4213-co]|uniref:Gfo/Idh/MocA family oxidoreductase n=1 Tax=Ignisphaera cupida TaxID=3050454 RepID=A0ABD4Z533_9CREN|nr:Gfo/Idh/MocA family oxidoreductase [Ignisphaera sp. 4213-co]MDK6028107.1 Gfo/Idh/MocA family oxidoreductase [Ignisphaera sp. 4213-co]
MIRLAIVSFAHMHAWSYIRVVKELEAEGKAVLEAIYDDNTERLRKAAEIYKPKNVYSSFDKVIENKEIDAVIIASENARHAMYAIPLMKEGKHVLVEKPIATTINDAKQMVEAAKKSNVKLQVAFVMRYHDAAIEVKNIVNKLGKIWYITSTNHGTCPFDWFVDPVLAGGGAMMDHIVHVADLIRFYTGREFYEVTAFIGRNLYPELKVEDNALLIAKLDDGTPVSIDCSWSRPKTWPTWGDVYMHIVGERGAIILNAFNQNIWIANTNSFKWHYFGPDADKNMILDFIDCIKKDRKPKATGEDGLKALEVVVAAYKSAKEGRPIKISEIEQ